MITGHGISHKNYQLVRQIQSKIFYSREGVGGERGGRERGGLRGGGQGLTHGITSHNIFITHKADTTIFDTYSILDKLLTKVMTQNINQ